MDKKKKPLPPGVHVSHARYYLVKANKWIPLSAVVDGTRELHRRLATVTTDTPVTLTKIFSEYCDSKEFAKLSPIYQDTLEYYYFGVLGKFCGHLLPHEVTPVLIAQYLFKRSEEGTPTGGNRERSALHAAYVYAMRRGWAKSNPCAAREHGVPRNPERASPTDIESEDLSAGIDQAPPHYARVMQFAYITGMRRGDIIKFKVSNITPAGLDFWESKTGKRAGKRTLIAWTPTLRELVREILEARAAVMNRNWADKYKAKNHPKAPLVHDALFVNRFGKPLTEWAMSSLNSRLPADFTFRQIRAKAQTDGGERNVLGHTGQMRERYTRRKRLVPVR